MTRNILAGIAAGLVSLVMLISATTGVVWMQFLLVVATPLPIYLVGLALGWKIAVAAAITGTISFAALAGLMPALLAAGTHFAPPVLLTYLVMLNRAVAAPDGTPTIEWYPVGRLVLWCATIGAILSIALLARLGADSGGTQELVRSLVEQVVAQQASNEDIPEEHIATMTRILSALLPVMSGVGMTAIIVFQLWLAGYIAHSTGNLQRPWPEISTMTFPSGASLVLVACILLSMVLKDLPGSAASAAFGAFFLAFIMLGLAVIHYVTRKNPWRLALLWAVYLGLVMFSTGFSVLIALIGITEPISPLRRDFTRPPPPPQGPIPPH